ncbi:copper homeostasis protein CutC [Bacillus sp. FJAT-49736]|uniref:copper homeostasis protein CutC n=1 Tax=Bacillus sp. FJAT-49736 TaxID=2833582 RepID=UPI001BC9152A|nr:copper homeostasis protein CutC [Bacillus sp. FJAT-49736]MBS4175572.1 copper homeostasis protein CutC [Bacillus sp. FJAT-49736]
MLKEVCVENFTSIPNAIEKGADRIELCDNLSVGGTTVSHGVALKSIHYCKSKNIKVMAIIRPRGGNFIYSNDELNIMCEDILHLKELQVDGVVMGCLNNDGWIDTKAMSVLMEAANGLDITFHMAFDHIKQELHYDAMDWLIEHGVSRILTHGGPLETPIEENLLVLQKYMEYADDRIIVMPGGGITNKNIDFLAGNLKLREVHGTRILGAIS